MKELFCITLKNVIKIFHAKGERIHFLFIMLKDERNRMSQRAPTPLLEKPVPNPLVGETSTKRPV
jgi:hypothetical protein